MASSPPSEHTPKQPVLQVFAMPVGLPRCRMRVTCSTDPCTLLARTEVVDVKDPLFEEPLELWDEASGKQPRGAIARGAPLPLTLAVDREGEGGQFTTLAVARISSDELRAFGLFNPREGAAVALPLHSAPDGPPVPEGAQLHCFVHAGYSRRPPRAATESCDSTMSLSEPPTDLLLQSVARANRQAKRHALSVEHVCRLTHSPTASVLLLQLRARNQAACALRVGAVQLIVPSGAGWSLAPAQPRHEWLQGVELPPGGRFEAVFALRYQQETSQGPSGRRGGR